MTKKMRSFRLEEKTIEQLESLAAFYTNVNKDMFNRKVNVTTVLETLIEKEYEHVKRQGYKI